MKVMLFWKVGTSRNKKCYFYIFKRLIWTQSSGEALQSRFTSIQLTPSSCRLLFDRLRVLRSSPLDCHRTRLRICWNNETACVKPLLVRKCRWYVSFFTGVRWGRYHRFRVPWLDHVPAGRPRGVDASHCFRMSPPTNDLHSVISIAQVCNSLLPESFLVLAQIRPQHMT
jgi:hypothetical protein